jgi:hypothetical protein
MRRCEACCREFAGRSADCPHCGFNNAAKGGPRSARSLAEIEHSQQEQQEFEEALSELTNEFAACLGWTEAAKGTEKTPA